MRGLLAAHSRKPFEAVLFDLDGTLADTAPDLVDAANRMRAVRMLAPLPLAALRPYASGGVPGMLRGAFEMDRTHADFAALCDEFRANYAARPCERSTLFEGIEPLLGELAARRVRWGIVTNKVTRLSAPIVAQLGLAAHAACVVCGDTMPRKKPYPDPLLHASRLLGVAPERIVYVGDDERDVRAARAARMPVVAAAYGYCGVETTPLAWKADWLVDSVAELRVCLSGLLPDISTARKSRRAFF